MTTLPEALVLLSAGQEPDPWRGRREPRSRRALAAAVFAELVLRRRLNLDGEEVDVPRGPALGDELLDGALARLDHATAKESGDLIALLESHVRTAPHWMLTTLATEGRIARERQPYRRAFTQTVFAPRDTPERLDILERLHRAAGHGYEADPWAAALLVLLHEAGLLDGAVPYAERARMRDGAVALSLVHPHGRLVRAALEEEAPAVELPERAEKRPKASAQG